MRVVKELPLIRAGNAKPKPAREGGKGRGRKRAAVSVRFVERASLPVSHEGVGDIAGENRDGVERAAGGDHAGRRESAERRLQPDDSVKRSGHTARSRRVSAKRERDEARADRRRRAGARSSGYQIRAQSVAWNPIGRTHADKACRKLVEIGLADDDRARPFESLDDERGFRGAIGEGGTSRGRRKSGDINIVFNNKRNAAEGLARGAGRLHAVRDRHGLGLRADRDEERRIVVLLDACVSLLDRGRERLARGVRGEKRSDRHGHLVKVTQGETRRSAQASSIQRKQKPGKSG